MAVCEPCLREAGSLLENHGGFRPFCDCMKPGMRFTGPCVLQDAKPKASNGYQLQKDELRQVFEAVKTLSHRMLPSWFTKLRDVKAGSKHKQQNNPHLSPSLSSKKQDEDPLSFAKSLSLQRANSKARNARFEAAIDNACSEKDDSCPSISNESASQEGVQYVCNLQASELGKDATGALLMRHCTHLDPWDRDFIPMSSCKSVSKLLPGKETKALAQRGHGVSDNDTEDFALTSETRSSFCSETSSADSSLSCKCGSEEDGHQDEQILQEGDSFEALKSPSIEWRNSQKACTEISGYKLTEDQKGSSRHVERSPDLMSRLCQESVQIRQSLLSDAWRGKQSFLYSNLMTSRCSSVNGNAERNSSFFKSNADKSSFNLKEKKERCNLTESSTSLIKSNADKTSAFLNNLTSMHHERIHADNQAPNKVHEKRNANAAVILNLASNGDKHRRISDPSENSSSDTLAHNAWQEDRDVQHSIAESPIATMSNTWCAQKKSTKDSLDNKRRAFTMRRRQRGSSISAVLPPDLQGVVGDSLALVKMSEDPYEDFRESMYEMIMEKDLEGSMDVEELLYCYLTLNSPEHHELIKEVFSDVWSAILMTLR